MCKFTVHNESVDALLDRTHIVSGLLSSLRAWFLKNIVLFLCRSDGALTTRVSADDRADLLCRGAVLLALSTSLFFFLIVLLAEHGTYGLGEQLEES